MIIMFIKWFFAMFIISFIYIGIDELCRAVVLHIKVNKALKDNGLYFNKYDRKYWKELYLRDIKENGGRVDG